MPQVGVSNEPLYERLIFGYDGTDYRVIKVDSSGQIVLATLAGETIGAQSYGWISSAWQKDPLRIGLSGVIRRSANNTNLSAGANNVDDTAVPAGEYWVIDNFSLLYIGTVPTLILWAIVSSAAQYVLSEVQSPTASHWYGLQGRWVLGPGDQLRARVIGATLGDDLYLNAVGFRVDIDQ